MKLEFDETPCQDAADWLETQPDIETAWATCQRSDWMWWALRRLPDALPDKEISVAFARWCAIRARKAADAANAANAADAADAAERLAQADWIRAHCKCPEEQR